MNDSNQSARAFAERLKTLMRAKGYLSDRSRSGVDVGALSAGAGVSYEMARRYAEGLAMPRPDALASISRWLGVDPAALAYGVVERKTGAVDLVLLEQCMSAISDAQRAAGVNLTSAQAAKLAAQLYNDALGWMAPSSSTIAAILRVIFND